MNIISEFQKYFCIFKKCLILPEDVGFQTLSDYTDRMVEVYVSDINLWIQTDLNVKYVKENN